MAKPYPKLDLFDDEIQRLRDEAEQEVGGDEYGVATDGEIPGLYLRGFNRPRVSALMNDVLTGRWGLGTTTVAIADRLGTDHATISRAWHWGELSSDLEGFLMACPTRPADWEEPIKKARPAMHRSGFMSVADHLAGRARRTMWPRVGHLREVHSELLSDLLEMRAVWTRAKERLDVRVARQIISAVCDDPTREILPFWYTKKRTREMIPLIKRLRVDDRFAFRYLCLLQERWERIMVLTLAATEDRPWV